MASLQLPATMENLPGDVLSNVFIRLLAKQLAQMRCVSKSWNALLSQSSFIKFHLQHSIRNNESVLLFFYMVCHYFAGPFSVHPSKSPDLELTNFIKLPVDLPSDDAFVAGSVNGLICLYFRSDKHYVVRIWNPSLSAVLTLPPYSDHILPSTSTGNVRIKIIFRFGYDPKTDDYRVVKLASVLRPHTAMVKEWLPVEAYSMRKGSWKLITQRFPSRITGFSRQDDVCVDGHDGFLHWLGFIEEKREIQTIVAFDLGVETFSEIPLPDSVLDHKMSKRFNVLGVLDAKLCVMSSVKDGGCEVWVMAESWVKHHVFSQFSGDIVPYGFTLHSEFFFNTEDDEDDHLVLFDPIAAKVKSFENRRILSVDKVVDYVDSLVWVAPSERDISISRLQI